MAKVKGKTGSTRLTENFKRKRLLQPSSCSEGSYFTVKTSKGFNVMCKSKFTGKVKIQAEAKHRKK